MRTEDVRGYEGSFAYNTSCDVDEFMYFPKYVGWSHYFDLILGSMLSLVTMSDFIKLGLDSLMELAKI